MAKFTLLLRDYEKALGQLESVLTLEKPNDLQRAGCIQYFEFCFELAWKTLQAYFTEQGLNNYSSPRICLKQAFKDGLIEKEAPWLQMLEDRNISVHTYDFDVSLSVYSNLREYIPELRQLLNTLQATS